MRIRIYFHRGFIFGDMMYVVQLKLAISIQNFLSAIRLGWCDGYKQHIEWASARVPPTPITSLEGKDKAVAWPAASLEGHRKASSKQLALGKPTAGGVELVLATAVEGFQGGQTHGQNLL